MLRRSSAPTRTLAPRGALGGPPSTASLFELAPGGACPAAGHPAVARGLLPHDFNLACASTAILSPRTAASSAIGGVISVALSRVGSYPTVSPLPVPPPPLPLGAAASSAIGGLVSVALSLGSPRVAVNDLPALWSPDFPPAGLAARRRSSVHLRRPHSTAPGGIGRGRSHGRPRNPDFEYLFDKI